MNETYVECLVKQKTPVFAYLLTGVLGAVTAVCIVLALTTGPLAVILMFILGFVTYLSYRNTHVEYEYLLVEDSLSVDKILGKAKRKKVFECEKQEILCIEPVNTKKGGERYMDFSSKTPGAKIYLVEVQKNGETIRLLIEPDERLLKGFRQMMPRQMR